MIDFKKLLNRTPKQIELDEMKLKIRMADINLSDIKSNGINVNIRLYDALSFLAEIPELNIKLSKFDDLQLKPTDEFDKESYLYVRGKLEEAIQLYDTKSAN